jgi:hypothetical protein
LAFTCAPASVHLTRKNAYAVVEIEDRNGSLRSPKPSFSLDELSWQIAAVGIIGLYRLAGDDSVVLCDILKRERQFG